MPQLTDEREQRLSGVAKALISELYEERRILSERIESMDEQLDQVYRTNPLCQRISTIEGIGPVIATGRGCCGGKRSYFTGGNWPLGWDWFHGNT